MFYNNQNYVFSCGKPIIKKNENLKVAVHEVNKTKGLTPLGKFFNKFFLLQFIQIFKFYFLFSKFIFLFLIVTLST
jgi:hypothetical protein